MVKLSKKEKEASKKKIEDVKECEEVEESIEETSSECEDNADTTENISQADESDNEAEENRSNPVEQPTPVLGARKTFKSLSDKISDGTMKAIEDMGFTTMTEIQSKTIEHLLEGIFIRIGLVIFISFLIIKNDQLR